MKRFTVLDGLRGYFLVFMMLNHLLFQGDLLLQKINHGELGYVQDAQGFVFLSGIIIGLYYTRMIGQGRTGLMDAKILRRAYDLYVYAVMVLAVILVLAMVVPNSRPLWGQFMWEMYQTPSVTAVSAFLLLYQPVFMDILPQYIVYLVASPLLLRWVARGYWREVLGGSILMWLGVQLGWHLPAVRIFEQSVAEIVPGFVLQSHFNPMAWQIVFVTGLLLGAADTRGKMDWNGWFSPERTDLLKASIVIVVLFLFYKLGFTYGVMPDSLALRFDGFNNRTELSLGLSAQLRGGGLSGDVAAGGGPGQRLPGGAAGGRPAEPAVPLALPDLPGQALAPGLCLARRRRLRGAGVRQQDRSVLRSDQDADRTGRHRQPDHPRLDPFQLRQLDRSGPSGGPAAACPGAIAELTLGRSGCHGVRDDRTTMLFDGRLEMANPDDRTPEQIEREIEQTRRNTAATLAAIEDRLAPGRLMDEAWSYLRTSGQGQTFVSNLSATVRDNPIPVALLAISLTWLAIASSKTGTRREEFHDDGYRGEGILGEDDAILTEDAFRSPHAPAYSHRVDYVDPDHHHEHVSRSRADAPEGVSPSADTLLGRERSRLAGERGGEGVPDAGERRLTDTAAVVGGGG